MQCSSAVEWILWNANRCNTIQYNTIQYNTMHDYTSTSGDYFWITRSGATNLLFRFILTFIFIFMFAFTFLIFIWVFVTIIYICIQSASFFAVLLSLGITSSPWFRQKYWLDILCSLLTTSYITPSHRIARRCGSQSVVSSHHITSYHIILYHISVRLTWPSSTEGVVLTIKLSSGGTFRNIIQELGIIEIISTTRQGRAA